MTRVLGAILAEKRAEVVRLARVAPPVGGPPPRGDRVLAALTRAPGAALRLITEIKRRSPSAGPLSTALSVVERGVVYARGGAAMISVLCDRTFFEGDFEHVTAVRSALSGAGLEVPVLAKEFILDARQLDEAAARGADAALLIARIVDASALASLTRHARAIGLEPLVEVVTEDELAAALAADARVIGVNARDLDTLAIDPARAARVLAAVPDGRIAVHLSGLRTPSDVAAVAATRADAALMGEALMRLDDPTSLLVAMRAAAG